MKINPTPEMYRIMRVYRNGEIQHRLSVLRRATNLPRDVLDTVLNTMVRDELLTVRCVSGTGGRWENLYTLTSKGRDVASSVKTRRRADVTYRV